MIYLKCKVFQECDLRVQEEHINFYVILFAGFGGTMLITMFLQVSFYATHPNVLCTSFHPFKGMAS